jgi:hypothetical protein
MRALTVSFGSAKSLAVITAVRSVSWADFSKWLAAEPPETEDKTARGWYCPVEFSPAYRDSENFVARHALTLDYDHVPVDAWQRVLDAWEGLAFAIYTTASHTAEKPRFRVVMPLSRPATYDEFQAVVRKVATDIDIELCARESFTPAQCMFAPTRKPGGLFGSFINEGDWLDVDAVLAEYADWTDRTQWPHRKDGDGVHKEDSQTAPDQKPGVIGDFCRTFRVADAIKRFELPYVPTTTPGRWTYTNGSRPEGAIEYDDGLKFHSHHDTDPARGQNNAFDLVRLHRFGSLDQAEARALPVTERPSYRAMCQLALSQPELRAASAASDFALLGELGPLTEPEKIEHGSAGLARRIRDVLNTPTNPEWLIEDTLERSVIAIVAGPRGSFKTTITQDWSMRVAVELDETVYAVSGEGRDYDRRAQAWLKQHAPNRDPSTIPLYVVEKRLNLSTVEGIEAIRQDCVRLGIRPKLFVLDTFSKLSGGLEENDNTAVKQFIGLLDNGLKRAFGATVLLVAHTGHSTQARARGASALAADTDAEYIVSRNTGHGTVSVSRERFKSSPELPPLCYAPKIIDLGRLDAKGRPVTSLALEAAAPPEAPRGKRRPTGAQAQALEIVEKMSLQGESVAIADVIEAVVNKTPKPEGRDNRRRKTERNIESLVQNGWLFLDGEDRVSRYPIQALKEGIE